MTVRRDNSASKTMPGETKPPNTACSRAFVGMLRVQGPRLAFSRLEHMGCKHFQAHPAVRGHVIVLNTAESHKHSQKNVDKSNEH